MGSTRTVKHNAVHTLLSMVGPMIVAGELLALLIARGLTERDWLIMTVIIPTYGVRETEKPNPQAVVNINRRRSGSCRSLLLGGLLWTTVDIAGQVFRLHFHEYIDKIGEQESLVGYYAVRGDWCAIVACAVFIAINWIVLYCDASEEWQHKFAFVKLFVFGLANVGCLGYTAYRDINDSTPTTHADIGWPYMIYRAAAALNYEMLFELLPALMLDEREYLQGWCATIFVRAEGSHNNTGRLQPADLAGRRQYYQGRAGYSFGMG